MLKPFLYHMAVYWFWALPGRFERHVVGNVLRNQALMLPLTYVYTGLIMKAPVVPNVYLVPLYLVLQELTFTVIHMFMHTSYFWKYHKVHHQIREPEPIHALYVHPFEAVIGVFLPFMSGPILLGTTRGVLNTWTVVGTAISCLTHTDWHKHFNHHKYINRDYGLLR